MDRPPLEEYPSQVPPQEVCLDMWCLHQASPPLISPFRAYLLRRPLCPWGYWPSHSTSPHGEGLHDESRYRQEGSGAADARVTGLHVPGSGTVGSSDGAPFVPTVPLFQESAGNTIPVGGSATESDITGLKVTFESSTDKTAATGDQDVDGHGRWRTRSRDGKTQPASQSRGA